MQTELEKRCEGVLKALDAEVATSSGLPSMASRGREREDIIREYLRKVFVPTYRFGNGDIIDSCGRKSGQQDIVVEGPFMPNLPATGGNDTRLYLAEGVAAVIEVKSDLSSEFDDVCGKAHATAKLERKWGPRSATGDRLLPGRIPFFAVGYGGWKKTSTAREKLQSSDEITGLFVISSRIFVSSEEFDNKELEGPQALWGFIACVQLAFGASGAAAPDPWSYL